MQKNTKIVYRVFLDRPCEAIVRKSAARDLCWELNSPKQWRYASPVEVASTCASAAVACACSCALLAAIVAYGEITSLFVQRHRATPTTPHIYILIIRSCRRPEGNRTSHMDALVEDSIAFGVASVAIMAAQLSTAAIAVTLANWAANRMVSRLRWRLLRAVITQEVAFFDTNTNMNFASALTE
ncbi:unnamed protein product [Diatraea saccharalis]|uniref:ABC transmembrane type-1 domain-containing protein n=1 Tax=Diatraea saccharalis TaxID=40085 RepID=A0A9P0CAT1_9NEOP|nr:unnamed protein product [Diatraea saccharalis]